MNMVTGQALDLQDGQKDYMAIYALKTAQLISTSFVVGATYMGAEQDVVASVGAYGHHLGMAFQIADDILDQCENSLAREIGLDKAQAMLTRETEQAKESVQNLSNKEMLTSFAEALLKRKK